MNNTQALDKLLTLVRDAIEKGASVIDAVDNVMDVQRHAIGCAFEEAPAIIGLHIIPLFAADIGIKALYRSHKNRSDWSPNAALHEYMRLAIAQRPALLKAVDVAAGIVVAGVTVVETGEQATTH